MGYYLQAFIGKEKDVTSVFRRFNSVIIHDLEQGISLITLTEKLFNEITNSTSSKNIQGFEYLTNSLETNVLKLLGSVAIGYVEASYWGSYGFLTKRLRFFISRPNTYLSANPAN